MKNKRIWIVLVSGIAAAVCIIEMSLLYADYMLDKVARTDIPIAEAPVRVNNGTRTIKQGLEENTNKDEEEFENFPVISAGSRWGEGRVPVYVNDKYPIYRVERIDPQVENFLLFGVDSREAGAIRSQADTLIIVTLDSRNRKIKLTSILRDTQVQVPGKSYSGKINNTYATGGVGMLINTINQNFGLDIQKFVMTDFWSAACLVDIAGGVDIEVTPAEVKWLNLFVDDLNEHFVGTDPTPHILDSGLQTLSGRQAVAWARIRSVGNDYARTERQRTMIQKLYEKFKAIEFSKKTQIISEGMGMLETNLTNGQIIELTWNGLFTAGTIEQYRIPEDRFSRIVKEDNIDFRSQEQIDALHEFIYEN